MAKPGVKPFSSFNLQLDNPQWQGWCAKLLAHLAGGPKETATLRALTGRSLRGGLANQLAWLELTGQIVWANPCWVLAKNYAQGVAPVRQDCGSVHRQFDSGPSPNVAEIVAATASLHKVTVAQVLGTTPVGPQVRARKALVLALAQAGLGAWGIAQALGWPEPRVANLLAVAAGGC